MEDDPSKTVILFEFIPHIVYIINQKEVVQKSKGVVMILMLNGDVFFYPINMNQLNQLPIQLQSNNNTNGNSSNNSSNNKKQHQQDNNEKSSTTNNMKNKYSKYNISLNLSQDHKVYSFNFIDSDYSSKFTFNPKRYQESNSSSNRVVSSETIVGEEDHIESSEEHQQQQQQQQQQQHVTHQHYRKPRKVLLSHDKRLLLIIGCFYKGISSLTVYKILEEGPEYFQLIYYDSSFTFIDACFSSDSTMLVSILSRYPNFLFFLQLPNIKNPLIPFCNHPSNLDINDNNNSNSNSSSNGNTSPTSSNKNGNTSTTTTTTTTTGTSGTGGSNSKLYENLEYMSKKIHFEPRKIGPMAIIGPIKNTFGKPYNMTHIASNPFPYASVASEKVKAFEYLTWNDDGLGEFCFWNVYKEALQIPKGSSLDPQIKLNLPTLKFECLIKLIASILPDKSLLERESSPKNYILNMEFAPTGDLVMCIVRKENYDFTQSLSSKKPTSSNVQQQQQQQQQSSNSPLNGIGIQLVPSTFEKLNFNSSSSWSVHHQSSEPSSSSPSSNNSNTSSTKLRPIGGDVSSSWIQLTESFDSSVILSTKWSHSLFFGSQNHTLPCAVVKGKGILEFITNTYYSQFTNISDDFIHHCSNFLQLGSYHRLWINNNFSLFLITMTPKLDDIIEWIKIFENSSISGSGSSSSSTSSSSSSSTSQASSGSNKSLTISTDLIQTRFHKLSQMIGYNLFDLTSYWLRYQHLQQIQYNQYINQYPLSNSKQNKSGQKNSSAKKLSESDLLVINEKTGKGDGEVYSCLHLYKCESCKKTLLKPLVCGGCKAIAYCSRDCQKENWSKHQDTCIPPYLPLSNTNGSTTVTQSPSIPSNNNTSNNTKLK
ncbi:hypothetical protein DLAC_07781 [Tieghemostelium lacteum]|uniref:MYND-type domain-containing protein n=1 Tax=Tieghemostelium lacteum TaxID=361077 RepID=A0A151ZAF2_TIELA|nr:hypothetical protein DLAC_07781 [Tieghemostelium lacteum]|eukprot:KYQ90908.1 hypothetical protein DLAC_07781 [Tieghemostelium lacteum]